MIYGYKKNNDTQTNITLSEKMLMNLLKGLIAFNITHQLHLNIHSNFHISHFSNSTWLRNHLQLIIYVGATNMGEGSHRLSLFSNPFVANN